MFKLQLVLVVFVGIQIIGIGATKELTLTAKLKNVTFNITITDTSLDDQRESLNDTENNNHPEEGNYRGGDLLTDEGSNNDNNDNSDNIDNNTPRDNNINEEGSNLIDTENNSIEYDEYPEEGDHIEGDLLLPKELTENDNIEDNKNQKKSSSVKDHSFLPYDRLLFTALRLESSIWKDGLVPYYLNDTFTPQQTEILLSAFDQFAAKTCIRFYPRRSEKDYISFEAVKSGCASNVGRVGGKQVIELSSKCFKIGILIHELMHTLGFVHEQNRYDRDDYIRILFQNLKSGKKQNYRKYSKEETDNLDVPYDYGSILHYSEKSFSSNGKPTIVALKKLENGVKMGQRHGFSKYDLERIKRRYKCV